jgi:hypothetical protein
LGGCEKELPNIGSYIPVGNIVTSDGTAKDINYVKKMRDKEIQVWGFLDYYNISSEDRYYYLNRFENEGAGKGIQIRFSTKDDRHYSLFQKLKDLQETPAKILVKGVLKTYMQRYNFSAAVGVYIEVKNPKDIKITE